MSQHLYDCEACGYYGVAHYILVQVAPLSEPAPWQNVLLCTGCWEQATGVTPVPEPVEQQEAA